MKPLTVAATIALLTAIAAAQKAAPTPVLKPAPRFTGTLAQVMRGIYFPNANLIFDVQQRDPGAPKPKTDSGSSTDTYASAYTEWEKVENAAVALRRCRSDSQTGPQLPERQAGAEQPAGLPEVRGRHARGGTGRVSGGADEEPGEGLRRDQQHRRRLLQLPRGLPRQGTGR